jgi:hypothetical protein
VIAAGKNREINTNSLLHLTEFICLNLCKGDIKSNVIPDVTQFIRASKVTNANASKLIPSH